MVDHPLPHLTPNAKNTTLETMVRDFPHHWTFSVVFDVRRMGLICVKVSHDGTFSLNLFEPSLHSSPRIKTMEKPESASEVKQIIHCQRKSIDNPNIIQTSPQVVCGSLPASNRGPRFDAFLQELDTTDEPGGHSSCCR